MMAKRWQRMRDRGETVADIGQLGSCSRRARIGHRFWEWFGSTRFRVTAAVASDVSQALGGGGEDTPVEVDLSTASAGVGGHP